MFQPFLILKNYRSKLVCTNGFYTRFYKFIHFNLEHAIDGLNLVN
ncbi:hypothetical protein SA21200_2491 [Staphylococcus aureus subsp. aureus 21200]|nr:hypothetical protein CA347_667 [Staphylococcus aureus CA-347]AWE56673.1 hypothetical protein CSC51_1063 [Staphylococcus aureus]EGS96107.1 hypothetical protein SA21200_2491 [Staphylococcus aureus subsp. aureus 21200]EHM58288.1 hypothetical protein SA21202_0958 [Staphylococcus aureus subsp. aureus 21202]EHM85136.1 hypothetical protein SA21194_1546 [Staphylococcus aureus subsp. aureus 21194]EHO87475.1 hypothetical protein SA21252_1971 [Staphylococcus aureus subsp. aureus 21252]EHT78908.1 hypo